MQESNGKVDFRLNDGLLDETVVQTTLNVLNCMNLNITARILGFEASVSSQLSTNPFTAEIFGDKLFEPKSFALIYAHNNTKSMDRFVSIGQRQPNDTLLKFERKTVTSDLSSFPEHEFEYNDPNTFITQIQFEFNVSDSWSIKRHCSLFLCL